MNVSPREISQVSILSQLGMILVVALLLFAGTGVQARKLALVLGNNNYRLPMESVPTASADAKDMVDVLRKMGYTVPLGPLIDLNGHALDEQVGEFADQVEGGDEVLVFYSGHAIEAGGLNFLLPIDYQPPSPSKTVSSETLRSMVSKAATSLQEVMERIRRKAPANQVVIVDACRDTPEGLKGSSAGNANAPGVPITWPNEIVLFAAAPGQFSSWRGSQNDRHRNSVYTRVLLEEISVPGRSVGVLQEVMAQRVSELMARLSSNTRDQLPTIHGASRNPIYLAGHPSVSTNISSTPSTSRDGQVRAVDPQTQVAARKDHSKSEPGYVFETGSEFGSEAQRQESSVSDAILLWYPPTATPTTPLPCIISGGNGSGLPPKCSKAKVVVRLPGEDKMSWLKRVGNGGEPVNGPMYNAISGYHNPDVKQGENRDGWIDQSPLNYIYNRNKQVENRQGSDPSYGFYEESKSGLDSKPSYDNVVDFKQFENSDWNKATLTYNGNTKTDYVSPQSIESKPKVLRVAVDPTFVPFTFKTSSGELTGFDVDIAKALCTQLKRKCEFVEQAWDSMISELNSGKFDVVISSMSITEDRMNLIDFTDKYYNIPSQLVLKKTIRFNGLDSIQGKKLGVIMSSNQAKYAANELQTRGIVIEIYPTLDKLFKALEAGYLDGTVADIIEVTDSFLNKPRGVNYQFVGEKLYIPKYFGTGVGIALRKGRDDLKMMMNSAIKGIRANGSYKVINDRYFPYDIYGL